MENEQENENLRPTSEPLERAWLLIQVNISDPEALVELAKDIRQSVNEHEEWRETEKLFVVRADVLVSGSPYGIIASVNAENDDQFVEIKNYIVNVVSQDRVTGVDIAQVQTHVPYPPYRADGFIPYQEANPPRGFVHPTGHNAWG